MSSAVVGRSSTTRRERRSSTSTRNGSPLALEATIPDTLTRLPRASLARTSHSSESSNLKNTKEGGSNDPLFLAISEMGEDIDKIKDAFDDIVGILTDKGYVTRDDIHWAIKKREANEDTN